MSVALSCRQGTAVSGPCVHECVFEVPGSSVDDAWNGRKRPFEAFTLFENVVVPLQDVFYVRKVGAVR